MSSLCSLGVTVPVLAVTHTLLSLGTLVDVIELENLFACTQGEGEILSL